MVICNKNGSRLQCEAKNCNGLQKSRPLIIDLLYTIRLITVTKVATNEFGLLTN